jgi:hypothetical protein
MLLNDYMSKKTPWSRVLLRKLTVAQLVKKFPACYGNRMFITVYRRAQYRTYPEPAESLTLCIPNIDLNVNLPSACRSSKCFLPSNFQIKITYKFLISPMCRRTTCPVHFILLDVINLIIFGD